MTIIRQEHTMTREDKRHREGPSAHLKTMKPPRWATTASLPMTTLAVLCSTHPLDNASQDVHSFDFLIALMQKKPSLKRLPKSHCMSSNPTVSPFKFSLLRCSPLDVISPSFLQVNKSNFAELWLLFGLIFARRFYLSKMSISKISVTVSFFLTNSAYLICWSSCSIMNAVPILWIWSPLIFQIRFSWADSWTQSRHIE